MEFQHERERIFALDEQGKLVAEVTFPVSEGVADIDHTFVDQSLRGQGVARPAAGCCRAADPDGGPACQGNL